MENSQKLPPIGAERAERMAAMNSLNINVSSTKEHKDPTTLWHGDSQFVSISCISSMGHIAQTLSP